MLVEDVEVVLDIGALKRAGVLRQIEPGYLHFGDQSIAFRVRKGWADLASRIELAWRFHGSCGVEHAKQSIEIKYRRPLVGGRRPYFVCGVCGEYAVKMYLVGPLFACKKCQGLTYRSVKEHDSRVDRLKKAPQRVAGILSGAIPASETEYHLALKAALAGG